MGEHTKEIASTRKLSFHRRMNATIERNLSCVSQNELDNHRITELGTDAQRRSSSPLKAERAAFGRALSRLRPDFLWLQPYTATITVATICVVARVVSLFRPTW